MPMSLVRAERELKEMNGHLHDLLTNCPEEVIGHISDWVLYQIERAV